MNGVHDLGGTHGFPELGYEHDEPVFHHAWERRCFALNFCADALGRWNLDTWRHAVERMDPVEYLRTSYYEHWLHAMETLLIERGLLTREELEARLGGDSTPAAPAPGQPAALAASEVEAALFRGEPACRDIERPARFRRGEAVRTANINPAGHTRLPRYARAKRGIVRADRGVHLFPDRRAAGEDEAAERLYNVEFRASELWGDEAPPRDTVRLDLWESYLEPE